MTIDIVTLQPVIAGQASPLIVAIGVTIITGRSGRRVLIWRSKLQSVHNRHVYVRLDHPQPRLDACGKLVECFLTRIGEMQDVGALARLAAKVLTEQLGDIGLVIDNQDADAHASLPAAGPLRGRRIVNSVNSPGSLSTAIESRSRRLSYSGDDHQRRGGSDHNGEHVRILDRSALACGCRTIA